MRVNDFFEKHLIKVDKNCSGCGIHVIYQNTLYNPKKPFKCVACTLYEKGYVTYELTDEFITTIQVLGMN
jgi:hypothetical protein